MFDGVRGRSQEEIIKLSDSVRSELLTLVLMGPLACTNLRAQPSRTLYLVDASNWGTAVVATDISEEAAKELCRHTVTRGKWTRLLPRAEAWLYSHALLAAPETLPGVASAAYQTSRLWLSHPKLWRRVCMHISIQGVILWSGAFPRNFVGPTVSQI